MGIRAGSFSSIQVTTRVNLQVWHHKEENLWYGRYVDRQENQIGDAWFGHSRDTVLVLRDPLKETS